MRHKSFNYTYRPYSNNLALLNYELLRSDQCVYKNNDITVMVYVDDLLLIGEDDKIKEFIQRLESQLQLKHVAKLQRDQPLVFLGRQIEYFNDHIALSMTQDYYDSLLKLYNIKENTNSLSTTGTKRPPIKSQPLDQELTRAVQSPDEHGKQNAKHLLRYLHGTRKHKLHLNPRQPSRQEPYIKAYCDSDWAGCSTTRKSTTGTVLQFAGVTIATSSKTEQTIAQSSAEAELYAIGTTVNDVIYVRSFMHELNFITDDKLKPHIYTDSSSAKCLTQQLGLTKRTKHIDIRYLHVQQLQGEGELKIHKVSTENNPSTLMTKYLETAKIKKHSETIGLHPYLGNRGSINMINGSRYYRKRGSTRRGSTPTPRPSSTRVWDPTPEEVTAVHEQMTRLVGLEEQIQRQERERDQYRSSTQAATRTRTRSTTR
eukprot:415347-Amphidinium_carterae.1